MKYCPKCGTQFFPNQRFCTNCGNPLNREKKINKKYLYIFITIILIIIPLIGINMLGNKPGSKTIMIYMVGADLESSHKLGTSDLSGIDYDKLDKNVKVIMIAGGSKKWYNSYMDSNTTSIYELKEGGFVKVKDQAKINMGDGKTLSDFLNFAYDNYKARNYSLVFWNHGGGVLGAEYDELYNDDGLSLKELEEAFESSPFKKKKLETIIFSTCLNGTLEVASTLDKYANYLAASEEVSMSAYNKSTFEFVNDIKPADDGYDIASKFLENYKKYFQSSLSYTTYSVIDLSKIDSLVMNVNKFFSSLDVDANYNAIAKARSSLFQYGQEEEAYDSVDLYSLVDKLKNLNSSLATNVLNDITDAVVYNWATDSRSKGISIYFPFKAKDSVKAYILSQYSDIYSLDKYDNFIKSFSNHQDSSYSKSSYTKNILSTIKKDDTSDFRLELTNEQKDTFAKAEYIVFKDNNNGTYSPVYIGRSATLEDNVLSANIKGKQLRVSSTIDGTSHIINLDETYENDDYIKYDSFVILGDYRPDNISEWRNDVARMSLAYNKKTGSITIDGVYKEAIVGEYSQYTVLTDINDYQIVQFPINNYTILDSNGNYRSDWQGTGIITGYEEKVEGIDFKLESFDEGDYYAVFRIYDTHNNVSYSNLVKMN